MILLSKSCCVNPGDKCLGVPLPYRTVGSLSALSRGLARELAAHRGGSAACIRTGHVRGRIRLRGLRSERGELFGAMPEEIKQGGRSKNILEDSVQMTADEHLVQDWQKLNTYVTRRKGGPRVAGRLYYMSILKRK